MKLPPSGRPLPPGLLFPYSSPGSPRPQQSRDWLPALPPNPEQRGEVTADGRGLRRSCGAPAAPPHSARSRRGQMSADKRRKNGGARRDAAIPVRPTRTGHEDSAIVIGVAAPRFDGEPAALSLAVIGGITARRKTGGWKKRERKGHYARLCARAAPRSKRPLAAATGMSYCQAQPGWMTSGHSG